jgi:hypothetical protein
VLLDSISTLGNFWAISWKEGATEFLLYSIAMSGQKLLSTQLTGAADDDNFLLE